MGTAVASTDAEAFGGTIEYRRVDDRTVFEVRLPALSDERTDEPSRALV
ncbi:MAG: hypothetical protein U9R47_07270 [Actinomycetota bacterium]|nr:hypothetical protein [Actinomycetota bacterium]